MKKLTVFLMVLVLLLPMTVFAEPGETSDTSEPPAVEAMLSSTLPTLKSDTVVLIGGSASAGWRDFVFDMYPNTAAVLTVQETVSADWTPYVQMLRSNSIKAVVYCLDGNDNPGDASVLAETLLTTLHGVPLYFVSAIYGENVDAINDSVSQSCSLSINSHFVDVYSLMVDGEGNPDPRYINEGVTSEGYVLLGATVSKLISDEPVLPEVETSENESETSEEEEQKKSTSFRWLVPVVIIIVSLIIGVDATINKERKERQKKVNGK